MTTTQILIQAIADLVMGVGVFTSLACLAGAVMIFDTWLEERRDYANTSK